MCASRVETIPCKWACADGAGLASIKRVAEVFQRFDDKLLEKTARGTEPEKQDGIAVHGLDPGILLVEVVESTFRAGIIKGYDQGSKSYPWRLVRDRL